MRQTSKNSIEKYFRSKSDSVTLFLYELAQPTKKARMDKLIIGTGYLNLCEKDVNLFKINKRTKKADGINTNQMSPER